MLFALDFITRFSDSTVFESQQHFFLGAGYITHCFSQRRKEIRSISEFKEVVMCVKMMKLTCLLSVERKNTPLKN